MASAPHRLPTERAKGVELKLRARAEQLRPKEQLKSTATQLGLCHTCAKVIYPGDKLAMAAGIYLYHGDCAPSAESVSPT